MLFATRPQLAESLLDHSQSRESAPPSWAGDEVYGGRELRRGICQPGVGNMLAVRANHTVTTGSGRTVTAAGAAGLIPSRAWHCVHPGQLASPVRPDVITCVVITRRA